MRMRAILSLAVLGAMTALVLAASSPAGGGGQVVAQGACSGAATSKLKLKPDNGRIEVEFEVDQNVNGKRWRVTLKRNNHRFFLGVRTTHAPSGSFEVKRSATNGPGSDRVVATAKNLASGQTCRAAATF
jgi:hypothetical protein